MTPAYNKLEKFSTHKMAIVITDHVFDIPPRYILAKLSGTYTVNVVLSNSMYCVGALLQPCQFPRM